MESKDKKAILENYIEKLTIEVLKEELAKGTIDEGAFDRFIKGISNVGKETYKSAKTSASNYVNNKVNSVIKTIDDVKTKVSNAYTKGEMEDMKSEIEEFVKKAAELVAQYNVKAEKVGSSKLSMTGQTNKFANPRKKLQ